MKRNELTNRLNTLLKQKQQIEDEIELLHKQINHYNTKALTKDEKINLFKSLFIGRSDIYARFWKSSDGKKQGFSPVSKTFKGEDYIPLANKEIESHLRGLNFLATYPILYQNRCKFLVLEVRYKDAKKIENTIFKMGIDGYFEINSYGDFHIWIFFDQLIEAVYAKALAAKIFKESNVNGISYPNQDFANKSNLGREVALPLNLTYRETNKTVFVNIKDNKIYEDQWRLLQNVKKLGIDKVKSLVNVTKNVEPWIEKKEEYIEFPADLIKITLYDFIYIKTKDLSKGLIDKLKSFAVFDNPQVKVLQRLRKPLYNTPRVIKSFEEDEKFLKLPRGLLYVVTDYFRTNDVEFSIDDRRKLDHKEFPKVRFKLRDEQQQAVDKIRKKDFGICVAPPGFGKTLIGAKMIESRGCSTLIIVHKNMLLNQWCERFIDYFDMDKKDIGYFGKGKNKLNGTLDVATMQSLKNAPEIIKNYSHVIVDECHHIPAVTFENIVKLFCGRYILGLSATPNRKDDMQPIIYQQLGDIAYEHKKKRTTFNRVKIVKSDFASYSDNYSELITQIANDNKRNELIIKEIINNQNRKILVLSDRIEHIENLEKLLEQNGLAYISVHGSQKKSQQKINIDKIDSSSLILATTSFFGEGIDFPHLDTIIFATPISYYGRLIQYLGRIGRGGKDCLAIDILDSKNSMLNSAFKKRREGYRHMHYII